MQSSSIIITNPIISPKVASMTPAENPGMISNNHSEIFIINNTGKAPAPVAKPAARLATEPSRIVSSIMTIHKLLQYLMAKKGGKGEKGLPEELGDERRSLTSSHEVARWSFT